MSWGRRARDDGAGGRTPRTAPTGRVAVLAVALAVLALLLAVPVRTWFAQRAQIAELGAAVADEQRQADALEAAARRWQDPAYVAAQARSRLHYVLPGEVGYVVLDGAGTPVPSSSPRPAATGAAEAPWYARLWGSVDAADSGRSPQDQPSATGASGSAGPAPGPTGSPSPSAG